MANKKKIESSYDEFMKDPKWRQRFEDQYAQFLLSEIITGLMAQEKMSVRALARMVGVSPTVINGLRTGTRTNLTFKNFLGLATALGATVKLVKGKDSYSLLE
jgi:DNA-binding Xre family transcriptional regulator